VKNERKRREIKGKKDKTRIGKAARTPRRRLGDALKTRVGTLSNPRRGALGPGFQFATSLGVLLLFSFWKGASSPLWLLCTLLFMNEMTHNSPVLFEKKKPCSNIFLRLVILMIPFQID
jgi:hypothetical protein